MPKTKEDYLEFCKGSNAGKAVYRTDGETGTRIVGEKCWGFIKTVKKVSVSDIPSGTSVEEYAQMMYDTLS